MKHGDNKHMTKQNDLLNLLLYASNQELEQQIPYIYPSDLLDVINDDNLEEETIYKIINRLPNDMIGQLLDEEEQEDKYELLLRVQQNRHSAVLEEMSSDELVDMFETIEDKSIVDDLMAALTQENKSDVELLMTYEPDTAGGIMATEFINLYDNKKVQQVLEYLQEIKDQVESQYALYVTDKQNTLKGVVSLSDIATTEFSVPISDIMNPNVISVHYDMDQEDVAKVFDKYNLPVIPVIDDDNHILGIVTFDDIIEVITQEATADIHQLAGIDADEDADSSVKETVRSRIPWLIINLLTATVSSSIVAYFSSTIAQVVALAALMPIVTGMGGNVGSQTYTFTIRSLATGKLDKSNERLVFNREMKAAFINGIIISILAFFLGTFIGQDLQIGIIVGASMLLSMLFAAALGYLIPSVLNKMDIDPAIASSVLVTTFTDSFGFIVFLGLSTTFMEYLL